MVQQGTRREALQKVPQSCSNPSRDLNPVLDTLRERFAECQKKRLGPRFSDHSICERVIDDWAESLLNDYPKMRRRFMDSDDRIEFNASLAAYLYTLVRDQGRIAAIHWYLVYSG